MSIYKKLCIGLSFLLSSCHATLDYFGTGTAPIAELWSKKGVSDEIEALDNRTCAEEAKEQAISLYSDKMEQSFKEPHLHESCMLNKGYKFHKRGIYDNYPSECLNDGKGFGRQYGKSPACKSSSLF